MLVESDRHTDADLQHWHELSAADRSAAQQAVFAATAARARDSIRSFYRRPRPHYVATSWGKDSVVLLHMLRATGYSPKVIHVRQLDNENPESLKVRDAFLARFPCDYEEVGYSYRDADASWFGGKGQPIRWFQVLRELQGQYGMHITGVRADESSTRHLRFATYGVESRWSLAPLQWMTIDHVFAYLHFFDLPIHANYAMTGGGRWDRRYLRVAAIGNERGRGHGRLTWEREYFSDVLNRMEAEQCSQK